MGDENASTQSVLQAYNIMEVPTFLFFKNGREVGRHVGSSRGDLIGKILQVRGQGWGLKMKVAFASRAERLAGCSAVVAATLCCAAVCACRAAHRKGSVLQPMQSRQ
jgi:hypothetical protein